MEEFEESSLIEESVQLPCPSCGSKLQYSAKTKQITCGHCGYEEAFGNDKDKVVEQSLAKAIHSATNFVPEETGKKVFGCDNCGANFMVESQKVKVNCGFCGSENVNLEAYNHQYIQPVGIIPFLIPNEEATQLFKKWIKRGIFHPNKLKKLAAVEDLHGVYIPFWTYDAQTNSSWSGDAGHYYNETVRVRVDGRMQNRQVQKVRWTRRSGSLDHFFDDVLVVASGALDQSAIHGIFPYRLEQVINFDSRLMMGWEAEIYKVEVDEGYRIADKIIDSRIRNMCSAKLGGDTQRNLRIHSEKHSQTFKHIVLPVWICSYIYNNKTFRFTINGQTGKVSGEKPYSWVKIAFAVLLFIGFLAGLFLLKESGIFN